MCITENFSESEYALASEKSEASAFLIGGILRMEKVIPNKKPDTLVFRNISTDEVGTGICYVSGGVSKVSKINRPFVTLYLQDIDGVVIPGYIFDVEDFKASGLDLTKAVHSLVSVNYRENYLSNIGLTLILKEVKLVNNPPMDLLTAYVGSSEKVTEMYNSLVETLTKELGINISLPYTICSLYHVDYNQGKVGGLVQHYWDMCRMLEVHSTRLPVEERKQLFGTFLLYVYTHSNYIAAVEKEEADISLITQLTSAISKYMRVLKMRSGAVEIVHIFFGYEPKDIYVRLVSQVSRDLLRANAEINLWRTLPLSREGNAGYGTIKRYVDTV